MRTIWIVLLCAITVLLLSGCGFTCDRLTDLPGCTDSEVAVDTSSETDPVLAARVLDTILHLQDLQEASMVDEHKFYLPKNEYGFTQQGDAVFFQMHHIAAMCRQTYAHKNDLTVGGEHIFRDPRNDKTEQLTAAWEAMKSVQIRSADPNKDGRIFRHPLPKYRDGTSSSGSTSNDLRAALYYGAANVKYYDCEPIVGEMGPYLRRFATFAMRNDGDLSAPGEESSNLTRLRDWLPLHHLLLLYGESSPISTAKLNLSELHHTLPEAVKNAPLLWEKAFDCKHGRLLCEGISSTALYLNRLDAAMWNVEAHMRSDSRYTVQETRGFLGQLAKMGEGRSLEGQRTIVMPMWGDYRSEHNRSVNLLLAELDSWPADRLPTEEPPMSLGIWGCKEYVWNRIPKESCRGDLSENIQRARIKTALSFTEPFFAAVVRKRHQ